MKYESLGRQGVGRNLRPQGAQNRAAAAHNDLPEVTIFPETAGLLEELWEPNE